MKFKVGDMINYNNDYVFKITHIDSHRESYGAIDYIWGGKIAPHNQINLGWKFNEIDRHGIKIENKLSDILYGVEQ